MQSPAAPQMMELPIRDIHAAPLPPWWPPAPGWWVLAGLMLVLLIVAVYRAWRILRRNRFRRALIEELESLHAQYQASQDAHRFVSQTAILLRRLRVRVANDSSAASMNGERWSAYLAQEAGDDPALRAAAEQLAVAPYRPSSEVDVPALFELTRLWIRRTVSETAHA